MAEELIYSDPLGNELYLDEDKYVVQYPENGTGYHDREELPFQVGNVNDGVNGVSNELLLKAVTHRLERLEERRPSIYNRIAVHLINSTLNVLHEKEKDLEFNRQFDSKDLTDGDNNALEVLRWKSVINSIQSISTGLQTILKNTYRSGPKMRAVDIKRIKNATISKLFK